MGLLQQWGLGAVLNFNAGPAQVGMARARQGVSSLRDTFKQLGATAKSVATGLGQIALGLAPLSAMMGVLGFKASGLAADLEAQRITFDTLLGSQERSAYLLSLISQYAAATPFEEGDLIEGSKRLLRLSGQNVDANVHLLKTMGQLTALNPTKNITDAVEALLDASSGGGFERLKEFGLTYKTEDFKAAGEAGSAAFAAAVQARLEKDIAKMTGGRDLVKALSETFVGRLSTLKDAGTAILKAVGKGINDQLGPTLVPITEWISAQTPAIVKGVTDQIQAARAIFDAYLAPLMKQLLGWWDGLGDEGKAKVVRLVMTIAGIGTALLGVGAAAAILGPIISGLITIGTAVLEFLAPAALAAFAQNLLIVGAAAYAVFRIFREEGEGPLEFVKSMFSSLIDTVVSVATYVWDLVKAFGTGLGGSAFAAFGEAIDMIKPSILGLWDTIKGLFSSLAGDGADLNFWESLGNFIGGVVGVAFRALAAIIDVVLIALDVVIQALAPVLATVWQIAKGFVGLFTGSLSFGDFVANIGRGLLGLLLGAANIVAQVTLGVVQMALRLITNVVRTIPGMGDWNGLDSISGAMEKARHEFGETVTRLTQGTMDAATKRDQAKTQAAAPQVNVAPAKVDNNVNVSASVKVDGKEIARATGDQSVRAGERGTGPALPPHQRGRVLRRGLNVTPLGAAEVLPVGG